VRRSTTGFDRLFRVIDEVKSQAHPAYPPYNIEKTGEDAYRLTLAVAGWTTAELTVTAQVVALGKTEKSFHPRGSESGGWLRRQSLQQTNRCPSRVFLVRRITKY